MKEQRRQLKIDKEYEQILLKEDIQMPIAHEMMTDIITHQENAQKKITVEPWPGAQLECCPIH